MQSSHIFLRGYAMQGLTDTLVRVRAARGHPDRPLFALFPRPPAEDEEEEDPGARPAGPWTVLLEPGSDFSSAMAQEICRTIRGELLLARVSSPTFGFELERFVDGTRVEHWASPDPEVDGPLDAELCGWKELRTRGIPPAQRFLQLPELELLPLNERGARMGQVLEAEEEGAPRYFRYRIRRPRSEASGPPPVFNLFDGDKTLVDVYTVAGDPDAAGLERLLVVLDGIGRRKRLAGEVRYLAAVEFLRGEKPEREARKQRLLERFNALRGERGWCFELV